MSFLFNNFTIQYAILWYTIITSMTDLEITTSDQSKIVEKSVLTEHERAATMLQDFGLSTIETAVYIALLEAGRELGGSDIAKKAAIPRQYVYTALPLLRERGLVIEVPHGKQSRYKAVSQGEIEKIAKRKLIEAERLVQELSTFSRLGYEQDFEVIQGAEAIQRYEFQMVETLDTGDTEYIIGGASDGFTKTMGPLLKRYLGEKKKKDIGVKYIGSSNEEPYYKQFIGIYPNQEYRFMNKLPQGVAHMVVRKDSVSFYSFLNPPLIYVVKSPVVAKNYEQFFLMLWDMAEEQLKKTI
jgi:predicted transcriptional regulator